MRELVDGEDTYRLTEKQHKQLLRRFDVSKAVSSLGSKVIETDCICPHVVKRCVGCCLVGLRSQASDPHCLVIMHRMVGVRPASIDFLTHSIRWSAESEEAPAYIQKVREVLLGLPKTK